MEQVLCKDCKHSFKPWHDFYYSANIALRCRLAYHQEEVQVDPVTGPEKHKAYYDRCAYARTTAFSSEANKCGKEGQNWEPKNKRDLFKYIKHIGAVQ